MRFCLLWLCQPIHHQSALGLLPSVHGTSFALGSLGVLQRTESVLAAAIWVYPVSPSCSQVLLSVYGWGL
jgi:hypothetical protein